MGECGHKFSTLQDVVFFLFFFLRPVIHCSAVPKKCQGPSASESKTCRGKKDCAGWEGRSTASSPGEECLLLEITHTSKDTPSFVLDTIGSWKDFISAHTHFVTFDQDGDIWKLICPTDIYILSTK